MLKSHLEYCCTLSDRCCKQPNRHLLLCSIMPNFAFCLWIFDRGKCCQTFLKHFSSYFVVLGDNLQCENLFYFKLASKWVYHCVTNEIEARAITDINHHWLMYVVHMILKGTTISSLQD
ncbi:hypothetical protein ACHAXS_011856, partial [Conticribra weissflogii]